MAALSTYLDASVIVPLFLVDSFVARARAVFLRGPVNLIVSDFVEAEFSSVVGIRVRTKVMTNQEARLAFSHFDAWVSSKTISCQISSVDIRVASLFLRRLDLTLRAPDAINLAIAQRLGAELMTFDVKMAACANKLGIPLTPV